MDEGTTEDQISRQLGDLLADPLVWCIRPVLTNLPAPTPGRVRSRVVRWSGAVSPATSFAPLKESKWLTAWHTTNERRAYGSLVRDGTEYSLMGSLSATLYSNRVRRRIRELANTISQQLSGLTSIQPDHLTRLLVHSEIGGLRAHRLIQDHGVERVVVATQHSSFIRAVVVAASNLNVPCVYVPHAPVGRNRLYADLPFEMCALRGPREVKYYIDLGARRESMAVMGDASMPADLPDLPCPQAVVIAPSPQGTRRLTAFFNFIGEAHLGATLVCPHPRLTAAELRPLLPDGAELVSDMRTIDLVSATGAVVVQSSSGIAGEALQLGAPTIQVVLDDDPPGYPLIQEPFVSFARSPAELHSTVTAMLEELPAARTSRQDWAKEWCAYRGPEAEARLLALLECDTIPQVKALDGWRQLK